MKTLNNNGEEKDQQEANRFLYRENDEERERGEIIPTAITVRKLSKSFIQRSDSINIAPSDTQHYFTAKNSQKSNQFHFSRLRRD